MNDTNDFHDATTTTKGLGTDRAGAPRRSTGSAFRRVAATAVVTCALAGSVAGLGALGVLAAPGSSPAAQAASEPTTASVPKVTYTAADLAAFAASPYADDALNLAVVWGLDTTTAKGKAGAALTAGTALPFEPGAATTATYTDEQRSAAFFAAGTEGTFAQDFTQALGLAVAWGSDDVSTAKAKVGGLLLAHEQVPAAPTSYTDDQDARAFGLVGYGDAEAAQLAGLWQSDTRSAMVRAGAALLAGDDLPL
ncbi:hypothetical protein [Frigoribacterium sp. PhB24]|uniref:hypothetical protein n=1 Tax=Frigoribacterium sp. PhB24 TaxID=2485204 RepID=UPI000FB3F0A1|nr:hypothetical protein [Frigoribacterium sp. PhB24]ROS50313.1 hypothetical protein EDF50_2102 [Frigoribacterium sp. PhB24]